MHTAWDGFNLEDLISEVLETEKPFLDLGCGAASQTKFLIRKLPRNINVIGVDISEKSIKKAQQHMELLSLEDPNYKDRWQFKEMSALDLQFPNNHFLGVYISDSIHHILDPEKALQEAYRVTCNKGYIFITHTRFTDLKASKSKFDESFPLVERMIEDMCDEHEIRNDINNLLKTISIAIPDALIEATEKIDVEFVKGEEGFDDYMKTVIFPLFDNEESVDTLKTQCEYVTWPEHRITIRVNK